MPANPPNVRSVIEQIVSVQEHIEIVLAGLAKLATGSDGQLRQLARSLDESNRLQKDLLECQRQTEDKLNALITVVDGMVRRADEGGANAHSAPLLSSE